MVFSHNIYSATNFDSNKPSSGRFQYKEIYVLHINKQNSFVHEPPWK